MGATTKDPVRDFLKKQGIDTAILDLEAPTVDTLTANDESLFDFVGDDAAMLGSEFRLSQVNKDTDVQRLKARNFVVLADYRDGQSSGVDCYPRGIGKSGVVMGRPLKVDAGYKLQRAQRDHERRTGQSTERATHGSGDKIGTMTQTRSASGASVTSN